jgi:plastocyanin
MHKAWLLLAILLLSGCAAKPAHPASQSDAASGTGAVPLAAAPVPLHFGAGSSESAESFSATFQATDSCVPECSGSADQKFDITQDIPADAPVELTIALHGVGQGFNVHLVYVDTGETKFQSQRNGAEQTIAALLVRGASGSVQLEISKQFARFGVNGTSTSTTIGIDVHSVVRADLLAPFIPATVKLNAGDTLNFTSMSLTEVVVIGPSSTVRDLEAPFTVAVNVTGSYTILVQGDEATQVLGPNTTMTARRVTTIMGEPHDVVSGQDTSWQFTTTVPLQVGVRLSNKANAGPIAAGAFLGPFSVKVTSPSNVDVVSFDVANCGGMGIPFPFCGFNPIGGGGNQGDDFTSDFLDEHLGAGTYSAVFSTQNANDYQIQDLQIVIAE